MSTFERINLAQFDGHTPGPWMEHDADVTANGHRIKLRYEAPSDNKLLPIGDFTATLHLIARAPALLKALRAAYAEIDRLRASALEWVTVTDDPATLPKMETSILVVYADSGELALATRTDFNGAWMSHFDRYEPTPGDHWAYIPQPKEVL